MDRNEREEREGVVEDEVMSLKREAPSVAVQSVNVDPVMVRVGVSDRVRYTPPPFSALHCVNVVTPAMVSVDEEESAAQIAPPFVAVQDVKVRPFKIRDFPFEILAYTTPPSPEVQPQFVKFIEESVSSDVSAVKENTAPLVLRE